MPLHITQRGVNRCETFRAPCDFAFYRLLLGQASRDARCAIHAYALMTNHVHLLVTPSDAVGPAAMMRSLNVRYVRFFNRRYRRTGTLWEGRFHSVVVDSLGYLFECYRYIELNPVDAGIVADPRGYSWSSHGSNAFGEEDDIIDPHPRYVALGDSAAARTMAYRALFTSALDPGAVATFRAARRGFGALEWSAYREVAESPGERTGLERIASSVADRKATGQ